MNIQCRFACILFQVKYLSELTNTGETGSWLFLVGSSDRDQRDIKTPDQVGSGNGASSGDPETCEDGGRLRCHTAANCNNTPAGYCCSCKDGYYGNGVSCIKNDVPLRVSGKVTGDINGVEINGHLQSYVVLSDGRSYSAISPLSGDIGYASQLASVFGNTISWLFAQPAGNNSVPNGYQVSCPHACKLITPPIYSMLHVLASLEFDRSPVAA